MHYVTKYRSFVKRVYPNWSSIEYNLLLSIITCYVFFSDHLIDEDPHCLENISNLCCLVLSIITITTSYYITVEEVINLNYFVDDSFVEELKVNLLIMSY